MLKGRTPLYKKMEYKLKKKNTKKKHNGIKVQKRNNWIRNERKTNRIVNELWNDNGKNEAII